MQQTAGHRYQNTLDCNERRIACEKNYIAQALSHKTIEFISEGSSFDTEEVAMDPLTFKSQNNNIPSSGAWGVQSLAEHQIWLSFVIQ